MRALRVTIAAAMFAASGVTMTGKIEVAQAYVQGCVFNGTAYAANSETCQGGFVYICQDQGSAYAGYGPFIWASVKNGYGAPVPCQ